MISNATAQTRLTISFLFTTVTPSGKSYMLYNMTDVLKAQGVKMTWPNLHLYESAIAQRNWLVLWIVIIAAVSLFSAWSINRLVGGHYEIKAWIAVGLYYATLVGVCVLWSGAG
jgi:hypothetical protein